MKSSGLFITFEGGEGAGKSLQIKLLYNFLKTQGYDILLTREPGGSDVAEKIRKIVLTGAPDKIDPVTEVLLYLAARSSHWHSKIFPALMDAKIVLCDRFQDSSIVYQGFCKNVDLKMLDVVFKNITNQKLPDRTYLIDIDPKIGIARSLDRNGNTETRFEKMDLSFHEKVREKFLNLSHSDNRFLVIDGSLTIQEINNIIKSDFLNILSQKLTQN